MNIVCRRCRSGAHKECFGGGCECQACAFLRTGSPDDHIVGLHAQIRDLLEEREELLTEIRRLQRGRHPAGRALDANDAYARGLALAEALTERDAEHEGGAGA